jgi:hypothetical protein
MESKKKWWSRSESLRFAQIALVGVALGGTIRWMNTMAPPLPVLAAEKQAASTTNAPAAVKIEGASPSVRD